MDTKIDEALQQIMVGYHSETTDSVSSITYWNNTEEHADCCMSNIKLKLKKVTLPDIDCER